MTIFFKKIIATFFAICILLVGCVFVEYPSRQPYYINNSGIDVKVIIKINNDNFSSREQEIKNNDTLCNYYLDETCAFGHNWGVKGGYPTDCGFIDCGFSEINATYFKIEFLSEPKVCLVFSGNAKVGKSDIRYWENYISEDCDMCMDVPYYYTITPDLMQQAKEEFCDDLSEVPDGYYTSPSKTFTQLPVI